MEILFSPQVSDTPRPVISVGSDPIGGGEVLTINGTPVSFDMIPVGGRYPDDQPLPDFVTDAWRGSDGALTVSILLPISDSASEAAKFPQTLVVASGPVSLPE